MQTNVQIDTKTLRHSPERGGGKAGYRVTAEELAAAAPAQRNWRGILIALLVIAAVLALIVFSIALLSPRDAARLRARRPTLQDHLANRYTPTNATWLSDEELAFRDRWGGLAVLHVRNGTTTTLVNNSTFRELNAVDYKVSADQRFVLLISDVQRGWRHARLARYHIYDVATRAKVPVSPVEEARAAPRLQFAGWAPAGAALVFVHDNDIYYKPRVLKTLVCRITNNGVPGVVFNGVPDFLYESEVLRLERALWFAPDGQALMFLTYNDTLVHEHKYPWYGVDQPEPPAYPTIRTVRYPKFNTNNPEVTLSVVSLKTLKYLFPHAIQFPPPVDKSWYVRWSSWVSERALAVLLLSRPQNVSLLALCSAATYNCTEIYRVEESSRWAGLGAEPAGECGWCGGAALVAGPGGVFTSMPVTDQDGTWRHAVRLTADSKTILTQGNYEITQIIAWDERRKFLYVAGSAAGRPGERHVYRVWLRPAPAPPAPACLTCDAGADAAHSAHTAHTDHTDDPETENSTQSRGPSLSAGRPRRCLYNRVMFSHNYSYYVQECLGPDVPSVWVCAAVAAGDGATEGPGEEEGAGEAGGAGGPAGEAGGARGAGPCALLDGQDALRERTRRLAAPLQKVFRVQVSAGGWARVRLWLPPGLRDSDDLPLPLLLTVSGEPGEQLVTEQWAGGAGGADGAGGAGGAGGEGGDAGAGGLAAWGAYLAASRSYIVAEIDARGSGGQGEEMRTEIYQKLLTVDVEDQIAVLSYLRSHLRVVDGGRVGAWGRGAGGGGALAAAAQAPHNLTRCVAALAPLTHLAHHNSFWTERYGGWGAAAGGALAARAAWRRAGNLPPRRVLLLHATADLRAPPAHAALMAAALVRHGVPYHHQIYPDEDHALHRSRQHAYSTLEQFFDECLGPVDVADWDAPLASSLFPFRD